jgi:hypothetical protein
MLFTFCKKIAHQLNAVVTKGLTLIGAKHEIRHDSQMKNYQVFEEDMYRRVLVTVHCRGVQTHAIHHVIEVHTCQTGRLRQ